MRFDFFVPEGKVDPFFVSFLINQKILINYYSSLNSLFLIARTFLVSGQQGNREKVKTMHLGIFWDLPVLIY